jgi:sec-independent protein translocase protein TatA
VFGFIKGPELLIIFGVLLLLFGATRLPQLGKSLGSAIRNFKRGISSDEDHEQAADSPANNKANTNKSLEAGTSTNTSEVNSSKLGSKS